MRTLKWWQRGSPVTFLEELKSWAKNPFGYVEKWGKGAILCKPMSYKQQMYKKVDSGAEHKIPFYEYT